MQLFENILALVAEAQVRSLVEEHTHTVVGQLVAKAILVRVVDPFGHPQKGLGPGQTGRVSAGCKERVKMTHVLYETHVCHAAVLIDVLPAGILARQPPSTFTADSATAAGVATSSHAKEITRPG